MSKKVVSFSLFGNNNLYCIGAVENAKLCSEIYGGWIARFYVDYDVPSDIIRELKKYGCEIVFNEKCGSYDGLFWRFKPLYDDDVSVWISRDCDSRISYRERRCVDEWINSEKSAHVIRDAINHSYEIMAGMFGINNDVFKKKYELPDLIIRGSNKLTDDQDMLLKKLWPIIQNDHTCHDFWYNNKPVGEPTWEITDAVHFDKAYGCGLINYVVEERKNRHANLFMNKDIRDIPEHDKMKYGIFIGQKIDENNQPIFTMDCRWEYELRGINKQ